MMKHNTSSYYNTDSEKSQAVFLRKYGFMIAPARRDLGKRGLMQIPADAPCTDAEQLAAFADYFKA